jgi:hypothetical protein
MSVTTGKVAGVYVDLSKLKTAIEKNGIIGLGQRGFAAKHNLDQAGLSRRLRGLEAVRYHWPHPEGCVYFRGLYETAIEKELEHRGLTLDYFAPPLNGPPIPPTSQAEPVVTKPEPEPTEYPLEKMQQVANIVRHLQGRCQPQPLAGTLDGFLGH